MQRKRIGLPFSAIVDMDKLKLAMVINAINPRIGGILIRGPKGSGKSTIVRSLADILPKIEVIQGCPFNCNPSDPSAMCPSCREKYETSDKVPVEEREMVVVDLPIGATEDRVIGSLDVEKAIKQGIQALEPGILAEANQNILYVDEVNLLPDHIADDLLDAAATGWNIVEREGISVSHPSRFIFIGTMNPEEGELRPQLLDRFPLSVTVQSVNSVDDRVEVIRRNIEFETNPEGFQANWKAAQERMRKRIEEARHTLAAVNISDELLRSISMSCMELKVDGVRPDIVIAKAAVTLAAFERRTSATMDDVIVAADMALGHRTREGGFIEPATSQQIREAFTLSAKKNLQFEKTGETTHREMEKRNLLKGKSVFWVRKDASKEEDKKAQKESKEKKAQNLRAKLTFLIGRFTGGVWGMGKRLPKSPKNAQVTDGLQVGDSKLKGETYETATTKNKEDSKGFQTVSKTASAMAVSQGSQLIPQPYSQVVSPSTYFLRMNRISMRQRGVYAGKHAQTISSLSRGRVYGWKMPHGKPVDIYLPATIRAAAFHQVRTAKEAGAILRISLEDVREKLRIYKEPLTMIFVVDLSGSMLFNLESVRKALLNLHSDAYRGRDRVGIVALRDLNAVVIQHPITNLRVVASKLANMRISGYTPLAAGMYKACEALKEAKRRDASAIPVMVLVTDGSANVPLKQDLETGEIRNIDEVRVAVREYEDVAVNDAFFVCKIIRRLGIHTIVVNTNPHMYGRETYGLEVTQRIAQLTGGTHHATGTITTSSEMVESIIEGIRQDERSITEQRNVSKREL